MNVTTSTKLINSTHSGGQGFHKECENRACVYTMEKWNAMTAEAIFYNVSVTVELLVI